MAWLSVTACNCVAGVLLVLAGLFGPACGAAAGETLVVQGSTTFNTAIMAEHQADVEARSGAELRVFANKTSAGLQALLDGKADLAMTSAPLATEVPMVHPGSGARLEALQEHSVTRSNAVVILNPAVDKRAIAPEDLARILRGEVVNWQSLGGPDLPIRVVATREGGGVVTSVEARVLGPGVHISAPGAIRVQNGPQVVVVVEQQAGAIGITIDKLVRGHAVTEIDFGAKVELQLNLVSLGPPTAAMLRVIEGCRAVAAQYGL